MGSACVATAVSDKGRAGRCPGDHDISRQALRREDAGLADPPTPNLCSRCFRMRWCCGLKLTDARVQIFLYLLWGKHTHIHTHKFAFWNIWIFKASFWFCEQTGAEQRALFQTVIWKMLFRLTAASPVELIELLCVVVVVVYPYLPPLCSFSDHMTAFRDKRRRMGWD